MPAIRVERTEEGYSVFCPGLPGCWSQGDTEEEAMENIRDAIQEYLSAMADYSALQGSRQE
ncbi:MAG: type II toxin-antitoxin system HicB family antitoxin [Deltaproteobacteria bacterium]|nr:MAG: type II toxin-antitoxin system HicB family antitoxin [Deltaproteobacteria bacterium]